MMKRLATALVIVAACNGVAALAAVLVAAQQGMLSPARLQPALAVLRGGTPAEAPPTEAPATQPAAGEEGRAAVQEGPSIDVIREEIARREREVRDQWALIRAGQLQLLREREAFEQEKRDYAASLRNRGNPGEAEGYKREIEYLSSIKPAQAKALLRQKKDADVVEILLTIESRVGRKIIDACKTDDERLWMGRILEQLRQRNDRQAEVLAAGAS